MVNCSNFKSFKSGFLLGFADIDFKSEFGTVTIKGCMFFQKDDKRWIKIPGNDYEKNGEKKYSSFLSFENSEMREKFSHDAKKSIDEYGAHRSVFNEE